MSSSPAIQVTDLSFRYGPTLPLVLEGVCFALEAGQRCLLVGANGAGKTTLLRVIAGKHLIHDGAVRVLGRRAFDDTALSSEVTFLGGTFPFHVDVRVGDMLERRCRDRARCAALRQILEVNPDWHMHHLSDGQRRRVQLLLGLTRPYRVLLLDEITTDLDLVSRADLLAFLASESEAQGTTILYATHILDRLERWATHIAFLANGRLVRLLPLDESEELRAARTPGASSPLSDLVECWLRGS